MTNRTKQRGRTTEIRAQNGAAEILLYDEIGFYGTGAEDFVREIENLDVSDIRVRINSPGGSVFDGVTIFNAIRRHAARVTTHIDGLAASIASVIAMAGERVFMAENGFLMIHDPWSIVIGNADDMRREADVLDKIADGSIVRAYANQTGMGADEIRALMAAETWLTSEEALESGFVDETTDASEAESSFNLSAYRNVPDKLQTSLGPRTAERALRDAGYSRAVARKILSGGYSEEVASLCDAGESGGPLRDAGGNYEEGLSELASRFEQAQTEQQIRSSIRRFSCQT